MPHHCDRCKKKATHIRTTTLRHYMPYGNPYHPPRYYELENTTHEYACLLHFEEAAKISICGPHRWKELNANQRTKR